MSGVNRHPRIRPDYRKPTKPKTRLLDELLLWAVVFVSLGISLAYLGVFDGLVGR